MEEAKFVAGDGEKLDRFGYAVDVSGDFAVIGALDGDGAEPNTGCAYTFVRSGSTWVETQKLFASDGKNNDFFGDSVAISGDTLVIGASNSHPDHLGAVYVYMRVDTAWVLEQQLVPEDTSALFSLGASVAISGNTIAVGARTSEYQRPNSACSFGSAHVFVRTGGQWREQAMLFASEPWCKDRFGTSIALQGDVLMVGGIGGLRGIHSTGAVDVFGRRNGRWTPMQRLVHSDYAPYDGFGNSIAMDGELVVIGCPWKDGADPANRKRDSGAVYVYRDQGGQWVETEKLLAADSAERDRFGSVVALQDGTVLVSAYGKPGVDGTIGSVQVFERDGPLWREPQVLIGSETERGDLFGFGLGIDGNTILVGAIGEDDAGPVSGAVYSFRSFSAGAISRNVGANAQSHHAVSLPELGTRYTAEVDLAGTTGHPAALLLGYRSPVSLTLVGGQTLLVNLADPGGELLGLEPMPSPVPRFTVLIPPDPGLAGLEVFTQAVHFGGEKPFVLSNAMDLVLGH